MEFTSYESISGIILVTLFAVALLLVAASAMIDEIAPAILGLFSIIALGLFFSIIEGNNYKDNQDRILSQVSSTYSIELTPEELAQLDYPREQPTKFTVYGNFDRSVQTDAGFVLTKTYLVWMDGKMVLAESPNGETYKEIGKK